MSNNAKTALLLITSVLVAFLFVGALVFIASKSKEKNVTPIPVDNQTTPIESSESSSSKLPERNNTMSDPKSLAKPEMQIDASKNYKAILSTSEGDMTIELNAARNPITVNNFVYLAKNSFYDNVIFHRVIKGFMVQTGDPTGTGMGSPGYKFNDEPIEGNYDRGVVAMANSGPNTNGSQFFIMHADYPLPKNYVIFGKVIEGLDVLDKIAETPVKAGGAGEVSTPVNPPSIISVEIIEE